MWVALLMLCQCAVCWAQVDPQRSAATFDAGLALREGVEGMTGTWFDWLGAWLPGLWGVIQWAIGLAVFMMVVRMVVKR